MKTATIMAALKLAGAGSQGVRVRKQVYELTLEDLSRFPIWEFKLDEEGEEGSDESTVRPYTASGPLDPKERMFVVRAVFTLADGSRHCHRGRSMICSCRCSHSYCAARARRTISGRIP